MAASGYFLDVLLVVIIYCAGIWHSLFLQAAPLLGSQSVANLSVLGKDSLKYFYEGKLGMVNSSEHNLFDHVTVSARFEELMKGYDKRFRPRHGQSPPIDIELNFHVLSIEGINEAEMEFTLDIYFVQLWTDERLMIKALPKSSHVELIGGQIERIWVPDTIFVNTKRSKFHSGTVDNRFLKIFFNKGLVVYHARIRLTASCRLNLRRYPFDEQTCFLAIESFGHDELDMIYKWSNDSRCVGKACSSQILVYESDMANFVLMSAFKSKTKTTYHTDRFSWGTTQFQFKRRSQYFLVRVYLPCFLIVMVSWATFWIYKEAVPARVSICITTILTLITMLAVVNSNMPKVSYVKAIDVYLLTSFVFVLMTFLEYILVLNIFQQNSGKNIKHEVSKSLLEKSREKALNVPLTLTRAPSEAPNTYALEGKSRVSSENDFLTEKQASHPGNTGTHVVDMIARVLFPIAYGTFNFVYWYLNLTR